MPNHNAVVDFLQQLIACPSVTPDDAGCQQLISDRLSKLGFKCESMRFEDVDNLWARYGTESPLFVFAGHTDVVPPGPSADWTTPPFQADIRQDVMYGRGAVDMKGALAAMVIAVEAFIQQHPDFPGSIAFLITSDEEAHAINGTQKVMQALQQRGIHIDYCVIGEPSSDKQVGDQIRIGRRGSLHGKLSIHGKQGHVAHPQFAINPIHQGLLALDELAKTVWDQGNEHFPPTTFQITNIHSGTGVANVIPGHLEVLFNFRFSTAVTIQQLQERTEAIFNQHKLKYDIQWTVGAEPFLSKQGPLIPAVQQVIKDVTGLNVKLSTGGGTSDGRFIAPTGAEVVELGVLHATAHQIDECIPIKDLQALTAIYTSLLSALLK